MTSTGSREDSHGRPNVTASSPSTPPKSAAPNPHLSKLKETPLKSHTTDSDKYRSGSLHDKRKSVLEDWQKMVPEVEVAWFLEHVLPNLPEKIDLNAVVNHLKSRKVIIEGGWAAFPKDPKRDTRHEDVVYSQLEDIFNSVVAAVNTLYPSISQQFALLVRPTRPPDSERGSCTKPDSSFVPVDVARRLKKDPNGSYEWYDIAEVSEVKKADEASITVRNEVSISLVCTT